MSAIQSLLRVMTLRDAEAMVLETGKVPQLRRRGLVEGLAMPALEGKWLDDFVAPLLTDRPLGEVPSALAFTDDDGTTYQLTVERVTTGLRMVVRKGSAKGSVKGSGPQVATPAAAVTPGPAAESKAWWTAKPSAPAPIPALSPPSVIVTGLPSAASVSELAPRVSALLGAALVTAREQGASDILFSSRQSPRMRIDGRLEVLDVTIDDAELAVCVGALVAAATRDAPGDPPGGADLSLEVHGIRARLNAFLHLNGVAIAARLIQERIPGLADLALPAELGAVVDHRDGLVLVCGPTGSGKSTTLASLVDLIDQRRAAHIITLEDPIEYRFTPRRGIVHQREIGTHAPTFAAGLRAALREAPDVILLGELRDRATISAALTAAETGHLVLATLHAPSAAGAVDRIIDAFPEAGKGQVRWQLAAVLRHVVTQYLLPRQGGGRAPAIELVPATNAVCNIIRKGDLHTLATAIQSGRDVGMIPLERSLARLLETGMVSREAVKKIAADHDLLGSLAAKLR